VHVTCQARQVDLLVLSLDVTLTPDHLLTLWFCGINSLPISSIIFAKLLLVHVEYYTELTLIFLAMKSMVEPKDGVQGSFQDKVKLGLNNDNPESVGKNSPSTQCISNEVTKSPRGFNQACMIHK